MGQKVSPHGLRVGIIKDWSSTWYANKKDFSKILVEDYKIREYLKNLLKPSGIYKLVIQRKGETVKDVDLAATLVAENIATQLEKRISFRKAMKQAMQKAMKAGALGIKTAVSGRLGGAEIARCEHYAEGTIPLQTLRADIDYGFAEADTTYGKIGVKVWIYKGEVLPAKKQEKGGN